MLTSSFTLAHNMKDLTSQITALHGMDLLHRQQAANGSLPSPDKQAANLQYLEGKLKLWSTRLHETLLIDDGRGHAALLRP